MKKISFLLVSIISLSSCQKMFLGTDTGNPFNDGLSNGQDCNKSTKRCLKNPYILTQVGHMCRRLNACFQNDEAVCNRNILSQTGLNDVLTSLSVNTYSLLNNKYNQTDKIKVDNQSFDKCIQSIDDIDCSSDILNSAYIIENPNDYTHIHKILFVHASCLNTYSEVER